MFVWPLTALSPEDHGLALAFRSRVERINGVPAAAPANPPSAPRPQPWLWLFATIAAVSIALARLSVPTSVFVRVAIVAIAVALPLACGGSSSTPTAPSTTASTTTTTTGASITLPLASCFTSFPTRVTTRTSGNNLLVDTDGMAEHTMMVGIRSWQQQVPLPQAYTGANAYTIPLTARLADAPVSARTALFNGAIALAVNGIPIFNALNNRGDDAFLFGELDDFGGHAGRADDYHYHAAPFMLSATVGATRPIAVALDGFPIYGTVEPDGSAIRAVDSYNGHTDAATLYHYHGTSTYPYINGGMRGVVTVVDDHVDPQPTLRPVRPSGTPLAGATITAFRTIGTNAWHMEYRIGGAIYSLDYRIEGTRYTFVFTDPTGTIRTETYTR